VRILTWKDLPDLRRAGRRRPTPAVEQRVPPSAVLIARRAPQEEPPRDLSPEADGSPGPADRAGWAFGPGKREARAGRDLALLWTLL